MKPPLEVEVHEWLKRAPRVQEVVPHALKPRHNRCEGAFHRWRVARPGEELGKGQDWRIIEDVQPAACVRAYINVNTVVRQTKYKWAHL